MARRRRRLGVLPSTRLYSVASGAGKMWHRVLPELRADFTVWHIGPTGVRSRVVRPHVWVHDGHLGPIEAKAPVVAELHENAWDHPDTKAHIAPDFIARHADASRVAAVRARRILTLSEYSRQQIVDGYGVSPEKVVVAGLGVDHELYRPGAPGARELITGAGGDPERPYVLFISQLHPRKNLGALRDAMTRLAAGGFPHGLVVVGGRPGDRTYRESEELEREAIADLPGTTGRVLHFEGLPDAELAGLVAGAAAFCSPSLMEGFGLSVLEAMACAVPVVVSDRGALPELVDDAGIVTEPSADALEAGLREVLSDDARAAELGAAGRERSRRYTWTATAAQWRRALGEAIADS